MDLIERYLHAVKNHLPPNQQDDVVAELRDDLQSRLEDREAELGRPPTEDEIVAILKSLGRPMLLAARYARHQLLIGPTLMPYYWQTLKVGAGIALLVQIVLATVLVATGRPVGESLAGLFKFPFLTLPMLFAWVTGTFIVLERNVTRVALADTWNPKTLQPVPTDGRSQSRVPIVGDMIGLGIALAWWLAVPARPFLLLGPAAAFVKPGPGWHASYLPVAGLMVVAIAAHAAALMKPALRLPTRLAAHALALVGMGLLAFGGDLLEPVTAVASGHPPANFPAIVGWIDRCVVLGLSVAAVITVFEMGRDLWRLSRARRPGVLEANASTRPGSPR
jgi:hypothetical protein